MSTKSTKSTQSVLRNSFAALQSLDDHLDATPAKKKTVEKKAEQVVNEVKQVAKAPSTESQKKKEKKERQKAAAASNSSSGQKKTAAPAAAVEAAKKEVGHHHHKNSTSPLLKMMVFAVLLLVLPIGAYYWAVHQAGLDLSEIKSALLAVLVVNALLFIYILMAFLEDSKIKRH